MLNPCASIGLNSFLPYPRARVEAKMGAHIGKEGINRKERNIYIICSYIFPKMNSFPRHLRKDASLAKMRGNELPRKMHLPIDAPPPSKHKTLAPDGCRGSIATKARGALKHCRCVDCLNFSKAGSDYFCTEYIGGTAIVWATGQRICEPPPDAWHYCVCYRGPQISKDIWLWPCRSRHVGAGSNISRKAEQGYDHAPVRDGARCVKRGKVGKVA